MCFPSSTLHGASRLRLDHAAVGTASLALQSDLDAAKGRFAALQASGSLETVDSVQALQREVDDAQQAVRRAKAWG